MILLVEDHAISRYAIARILRNESHDVIEAADGNEALALLAKLRFALVITDLVMPNLDGLGLVAQIFGKWPDTPILLMSTYLSVEAGKLVSAGLAEFIYKPIDMPAFIAIVLRLVHKPN
jgi:CheY-like chemotaxis protein